MKVGDVVTHIEGNPVFAFSQLKDFVENSNGEPISLTVWNDGDIRDVELAAQRVDEQQDDGSFVTTWRIGVVLDFLFEPKREMVSPFDAIKYGTAQVGDIIHSSLSGLYHVLTGAISTCNLSGPVGIAETSGAMASQGIDDYVYFIAFLSSAIGLMNLLPIPVLDGGHLVFHVYEAITRRPPPEKAFRFLMSLGLTIVLMFMVFAVTNDIACSV
jgi:regulator of sigma E protease